MGLMTLGMNTKDGGTDIGAQIYLLSMVKGDNPISLMLDIDSTNHGLYFAVYSYLYSIINLSPIAYISLIAIVYYFLILVIMYKYARKSYSGYLYNSDYTKLILIAVCSFSPIYICVTRNLFAIILFLISLMMLFKKRYILSAMFAFLSYNTHEGMILIITMFLFAILLNKLVLPRFSNNKKRNAVILLVSVALLMVGPFIFSVIGGFAISNNITSDTYNEMYVTSSAGDGIYKRVLILSMLGSLYSLVYVSIKNRSNDIINAICISGLFFICALMNQKIFFVQRLMMFLPVFIGCSLISIYNSQRKHFNIINVDSFLLLSVPAVLFCQFFFWRNIFFSV